MDGMLSFLVYSDEFNTIPGININMDHIRHS